MARPRISELPMTAAERKRRQREKSKTPSTCHETSHETKKFDAKAKANEIYNNVGAEKWSKEERRLIISALIADITLKAGISDLVMIFIMQGSKRQSSLDGDSHEQ